MQTYNLENSDFRDGWHKWTLEISDPGAPFSPFFNLVDGAQYGLATNRGSPNGFPTVGNSYMLLARQILKSNDINNAFANLYHDDTLDFKEGDIVEVDFGAWQFFVNGAATYRFEIGYWTTFFNSLANFRVDVYNNGSFQPQRLACRFPSDISARLAFRLRATPGLSDSLRVDYVCLDNVKIYNAFPNIDNAESYNDSGVS